MGWPSRPLRALPPAAPAVFACVPHSCLASRGQVLFFWVVLGSSCSISHTPEPGGSVRRATAAWPRHGGARRPRGPTPPSSDRDTHPGPATAGLAPQAGKTGGRAPWDCFYWRFAFIGGDIAADATRSSATRAATSRPAQEPAPERSQLLNSPSKPNIPLFSKPLLTKSQPECRVFYPTAEQGTYSAPAKGNKNTSRFPHSQPHSAALRSGVLVN